VLVVVCGSCLVSAVGKKRQQQQQQQERSRLDSKKHTRLMRFKVNNKIEVLTGTQSYTTCICYLVIFQP